MRYGIRLPQDSSSDAVAWWVHIQVSAGVPQVLYKGYWPPWLMPCARPANRPTVLPCSTAPRTPLFLLPPLAGRVLHAAPVPVLPL